MKVVISLGEVVVQERTRRTAKVRDHIKDYWFLRISQIGNLISERWNLYLGGYKVCRQKENVVFEPFWCTAQSAFISRPERD